MKSIAIKPGVLLFCATSLAISLAIPAITSTSQRQVSQTIKITPASKKVIPASKVTPAPINRVNPTTKNPPTIKASPTTISSPTPVAIPTPNGKIPLVAVPPLTPQILKSFPNLYGQLISVKLTPRQQQQISQRMNKDWMTNIVLRTTVMQTLAMEPKILRGTPAEKNQLQTKLISDLRQATLNGDPDALWLVAFFDASSKNWLAPGQPPLTRMTSDISADALCFMVNEIMGRQVATPDSNLKNSIATKLTAEYPQIAPRIKQELSRLPAAWLRFRDDEWSRRGEDFREQMRLHWAKNLEAYIPEIKAMSKLRSERLARLKADPIAPWDKMNSLQRQSALAKPDLIFQNAVRALPQIQTVQLNNYIDKMPLANAIGNSPTRHSLRLNIK